MLVKVKGKKLRGAGGGGRVGGGVGVKKTKCFVYIECALKSYS